VFGRFNALAGSPFGSPSAKSARAERATELQSVDQRQIEKAEAARAKDRSEWESGSRDRNHKQHKNGSHQTFEQFFLFVLG
jgi:Flp pilus assembly protein TadB